MDRLLLEAENTIADSYGALDSQMNRIEDMLSYFNDIFLTGTMEHREDSDFVLGAELLCSKLASCLWEYFVGPALLWPLLEVGSRPCESNYHQHHDGPCAGIPASYGISSTGVFRVVSSLCVLERLFHILETSVLCEAIACCLLAGDSKETNVYGSSNWMQIASRMYVIKPRNESI